jgi:pimeloyl-ACP methyl ester carboxylesterase
LSLRPKPSIVFAHGIWADGSCFNKVIPPLQAEGYEVMAARYGLDNHAADVAALINTLGQVNAPAILVGHSYGGSVITAVGADDRVAALVYIAALAPDEDETSQSLQEQFPVTDVLSHTEVANGRVWMRPSGIECFAGDLSEHEKRFLWATHAPPAADLLKQKVRGVAWRCKPTSYLVAKNDRTLHPRLQRFVARRMRATIYEVSSSHVPMLSRPHAVLDVIRTAAADEL